MTSAGRRAVIRGGTNVNPSLPTTRLVTDGVFGHTRNPLYVGISVALCGIALIFDLDWVLLLIVPSSVFLHFAVVRREERYLEQKFGDAYRRLQDACAPLFRRQLSRRFRRSYFGHGGGRRADVR